MNIIHGKDAINYTGDYDVVLVGTSIYCMLTNGFQSKIRFKYPQTEQANNRTGYGDARKLGDRLTVDCGDTLVSLMFITRFPNSRRVFLEYDALEKALLTARAEFADKRIMTTVLGCTPFDGNGDRGKCLEIMERCLDGMDVDVYDYEQIPRMEELRLYEKVLSAKRLVHPERYQRQRKNWDELMACLYLNRKNN